MDKSYIIKLEYDGNYVKKVEVTNTMGTVRKFVLEEDCPPTPEFAVGDIVRMTNTISTMYGARGVVTKLPTPSLLTVEFGRTFRDHGSKTQFNVRAGVLEVV